MSVQLNFNDYNKPQPLDIRKAKDLVISARAVNEQNKIAAENSIRALKQVASRLTPEIVEHFASRGIDVSNVHSADWDLLISSEEYRNRFVKIHYEVLDQLVRHIQTELGQL